MSDIYCYYHKNRTAVDKCEKCGKYLCVECKQNVSHAHSRSSGKTSSTYYTHHIYCPDCAVVDVVKQNNPLVAIIPCFMFLIFIIAVAAMGGFEYAPPLWIGGLVLMGILIFSTIIYQFAIKAPAERKKAEEIQKKARQALRTSKSINKSETGIKKGQFALYCKFCGAPIEENAQSCKYCGMNWKWK